MPYQNLWTRVDECIMEALGPDDPDLSQALAASEAAQLPAIAVSAPLARFLYLQVKICAARRVLEIGTLGGYSAIAMAKALPEGGRLVTLENNPVCAPTAQQNFINAGLEKTITLRFGEALESLAAMREEGEEPFDFIFIDANKPDYPEYLTHCLGLSRPGTVIIADNTVRGGAVADGESRDYSVQGVRRMHEMTGKDSRLEATAIQTVGAKGHDGFTLIRVEKSSA